MASLNLGSLNAKQEEFIKAIGKYRYIAYGGARGGGKTHALRIAAIWGCLQYDGLRVLIVRRTYPELQSNHIAPIRKLVPESVGVYNIQLHEMTFLNGSTIKFGHFQSYESAFTEYQGQEYDWIMMDEATQFTEEEFRLLGGCLRGVNDYPKTFFLTCNPGGCGHFWVKRLFIDKDYKTDGNEEENEHPEDYFFIQAMVTDNTALMETKDGQAYLKMLSSLPENIRAAHRYGDWDVLSGNYFPEFKKEVHVCEPFKIPEWWARYRSIDYGLDMLACLWYAVDELGKAYVYREFYQKDLTPSMAAECILEHTMPSEVITCTYAPPDLWARDKNGGKSIYETITLNGVPLIKADNSRVQGWMQVKEFLLRDESGEPSIKFFNGCKHIIKDIMSIQTDLNNPSDCAKEPHDLSHGPDSLRYFCISRTLPSEQIEPEREREEWEKEEFPITGGEPTSSYIYR